MLKKINNKTVHSSEGYVVTVPSIHKVEYSDGKRLAFLEIEGGMSESGDVDWLVYSDTLKGWEAPHDIDEMNDRDHQEILSRISECLDLLDMPHKIV